jgi:hypothetical protein
VFVASAGETERAMERDEIRSLLAEHLSNLRDITGMRCSTIHPEVAAERLDSFWRASCHLARLTDEATMGSEHYEMAVALVRLSRETVGLKRHEFQIHGSSEGYDGPDDDWDGDGMVGARIRPSPPPSSGHDTKPFPPEEVNFPGEFETDPEARI